jgi:hypothetical protein
MLSHTLPELDLSLLLGKGNGTGPDEQAARLRFYSLLLYTFNFLVFSFTVSIASSV